MMKLIPSRLEQRLEVTATYIQDGVVAVQAPQLWDNGYRGEGTVVAVIDTGCYNHTDLVDRIVDSHNFTNEPDTSDGNGHGTHVSGIIAGANGYGVAPGTELLILKVLESDGTGEYDWTRQAINFAKDWIGPNGQKVNVISMSLGGPVDDPLLHAAIKNAVNSGILVVCAAGNDGDGNATTDEFAYPACYSEVVSVGAYDGYGNVANFSDSNIEIDLVASGYYVKSTYNDGGYAFMSGTSMAAPHASGAAALIIQQCRELLNWNLEESEVYKQLIERSYLLEGVDTKSQGHGLLQLAVRIPPRSFNDITFEEALQIAKDFKNINGEAEPILDTPQFWINLINKYHDGTIVNDDFRYVELAFRKWAAAIR